MKITFYRAGYANNSSSSHSLIFTNKQLSDSSNSPEFGWDQFTASAPRTKLEYFLICLYNGWYSLCHKYTSWQNYEKIEDFVISKFIGILRKKLGNLFINLSDSEIKKIVKEGYVDHQSAFTFPCYRRKDMINWEFAAAFINEIVNKNYVVLGGNDNGEDEHYYKGCDLNEKAIIKKFYEDQKERTIDYTRCELDPLTNEWIVSQKNGPIFKIIF